MGNVYMEADQVRFKDSTYRNVQEGLAAALEGGGGGGTTVVANPEGSATADLAKLQVGTTIYGIPETAAKVTYDNTSSGLTADDVQEAIDEVAGDIGGIQDLIPSGATTSNKLATASDIPDAVTGNPTGSATAGNLTKLQIGSDIYNVPSGGSGNISYTETEVMPLSSITWTASGSGMYYGYVTNVVPAGYKIISAIIINWDAIRTTDNFILYTPETSPRNIGIMSPNNLFADTSSAIKLRVAYVPAT